MALVKTKYSKFKPNNKIKQFFGGGLFDNIGIGKENPLDKITNFDPSSFNGMNLNTKNNPSNYNYNGDITNLNINDKNEGGVNYEGIKNAGGEYVADTVGGGQFQTDLAEDNDFLQDLDLGELSGYIVPGLEALNQSRISKEQFGKSKATTTPLHLQAGVVEDPARPNFGQKHSNPVGTDAYAREASQKFGDVQQTAQEAQWELQASNSRIAQRAGVRGVLNDEAVRNQADEARAKLANSSMAFQRGMSADANARDAKIGLTQNLQSGAAQRGYVNSSQKTQTAGQLIRSGQVIAGMKLLGMDTKGVKNFTPTGAV
jgi:hypothetical protein